MTKHKNLLALTFAALFVLLISGCQQTDPIVSPLSPISPQNPPPQPAASGELQIGPEFTLTLPIRATDTRVQGTGAPNLPILVVNLTQMASELGRGTINSDGTFDIPLSENLVAGERIGLMIGELEGTGFQEENFLSGPGYRDYPFIGVVFTTTLIQE